MMPEQRSLACSYVASRAVLVRTLFALTILLFMISVAAAQTYPLRVTSSGRYLEDQTGTPVFLNGDAPWELINQATYAQANTYLTDRANRGFNALIIELIGHHFADSAPNNIYGAPPFPGGTPFANMNETYFAFADSMINRASALGFCILLSPLYLGADAAQGWQTEVMAASYANLKGWGTFLGNRYKNNPNIVWVIGADMNPLGISGLRDRCDTVVAAMKAADNVYPNRLYTTHSERGTLAYTHWSEGWVTLGNIYGHWNTVVGLANTAYAHAPSLPFILIEGDYENEGPTPQQVRAQAYWTILSGGCGHLFGNCPIWEVGTTVYNCGQGTGWSVVLSALGSPGSVSMTQFNNLFTSRHWYNLVPDLSNTVLTSGAQSGSTLAMVGYASDSSVILGYIPNSRSVTINPSVLSGDSIHVQWYNPSSGVYSEVGRYLKSVQSFTPASGDWVLVVDTIGSAATAPSPPTLKTPINGATGIPVAPTLTWNASSGATSYRVQVSTDSTFGTTVVDQSNVAGTSLPISGLANNTPYYWRVNASNAGGTSSYSTLWSFTTVVAAPAPPTLSSPANNATSIAVAPTLTWNTSTGATSYHVQVSTDNAFGTTVVDQSNVVGTSLPISGLANNTLYYWRANASKAGGTSAYSTVWSFTTIVAAPSAPTLSSPANNATSIAVAPTLTWNSSTGATSYHVQVSTDNAFGTTVVDQSNVAGTSLPISGLANNTLYYWRVNASNAGGTSAYSTIWSFTTVVAAPAPPTLSSPANNATSVAVAPTLSWNASTGATSYHLQVSTDNAFGTTVVDQSSIASTSLPISGLVNNTLYYWRVNASNAGGTSAYSTIWSFTTIVAAPAAPTLSSPANNATSIAVAPTLAWNASTGATSYHVQVSTDNAFGTTVVDQSNVTGTSLPISGLANNTLYYWRVSASNVGGTSAYSTVWSFMTIIAAPAPPTLSSPANNAASIVLAPTLFWNPSTGATSYHAQVSKSPSFTLTVFDQGNITDTSLALTGLEIGTIYFWRVSAGNIGGTSSYSAAFSFTTQLTLDVKTDSSGGLLPTSYTLGQNYPNPFNPNTEINFSVPTRSRAQIEIYDVLGRRVARLVDRTFARGSYRVNWNGRDSRGVALPSGVYFYRLVADYATLTRKMLLLK